MEIALKWEMGNEIINSILMVTIVEMRSSNLDCENRQSFPSENEQISRTYW